MDEPLVFFLKTLKGFPKLPQHSDVWQMGNKMEWDKDILTQQLKIRDFPLEKSLLVHGHNTHTYVQTQAQVYVYTCLFTPK